MRTKKATGDLSLFWKQLAIIDRWCQKPRANLRFLHGQRKFWTRQIVRRQHIGMG